jgi:phage-related protein
MFGSIGEVLSAIPQAIADALKWLFDLVVNAITSLGNLIVGAITSLGDLIVSVITTLLDGIISFFRDPIGSIVSAFTWTVDFLGGLISSLLDGLGKLLKTLFVPSDDYFNKKFDGLNGQLEGHVDVSTYKNIMDTFGRVKSVRSIPNITVDLWGQTLTIVDFSYIQSQQATINNWVRGFMFIFLVIFNINHVYKIIRKDTLSNTGSGVNPDGKGGV